MIRHLKWRARLNTWAEAQVGQPFAWGKTDCAALVRAALEQMFDEDVFPQLPRWTSAKTALTVLREYGSAEALMLGAGAELTTLPFLRAGDVIIASEPEEEIGLVALFVCVDGISCITSTKSGVIKLPRAPVVEPARCVYSLWEVARG